MTHLRRVSNVAVVKAEICTDIPVVPGSDLLVAWKEFLGYERVETGLLGSTRLCKGL